MPERTSFKARAIEPDVARIPTQDMVLEIEGLESMGDGRFMLKNVPAAHIDYPAIERVLTDAGIERNDAVHLTEDFSEKIFQHGLTKVLAQRSKRVG